MLLTNGVLAGNHINLICKCMPAPDKQPYTAKSDRQIPCIHQPSPTHELHPLENSPMHRQKLAGAHEEKYHNESRLTRMCIEKQIKR
jgi:hypothetical protein